MRCFATTEGLADGDEVRFAELEAPLPEPVAPEVPDGAEPELLVVPLPRPVPPVMAQIYSGAVSSCRSRW